MKHCAILLIFTLITFLQTKGQTLKWKNIELINQNYRIDGSISVREITDTLFLKKTHDTERFMIKKSSDFTYIAIRSNTSTILNAYILNCQKFKIFHASAALGQIEFLKETNKAYKANQTEFDWIYRDPDIWNEMHPQGVNNIVEFYNRYGWMASTWSNGSYREFEMLIDNNHFQSGDRLIISFTSKEGERREVKFMEGTKKVSLSGNAETDKQIHDGYIPKYIQISCEK